MYTHTTQRNDLERATTAAARTTSAPIATGPALRATAANATVAAGPAIATITTAEKDGDGDRPGATTPGTSGASASPATAATSSTTAAALAATATAVAAGNHLANAFIEATGAAGRGTAIRTRTTVASGQTE